ncbi:tRNA (adenosine(37)-N6)-threonylcarbamoyltransferase complex dimerization subunit type 1 TsaB [Aureimonas sp. ME7]|uniref:tRNA (adenosine(37)-N6)-threonylcarbamoyltransferase complex dimerization subunit type 1 TsaB n=1 Tax=Aureimonas sp. ME7 TaxID=2744252 RepID=UPI0015F5F518|nr:tRNA (adenosine(37)-N6)-threonylcarbamoyltransferase complex dimerization subunit type 1 TsaB [Aureimonas sp. ME7]
MTRNLLLAIDTAGERCSVAVFDMGSDAILVRLDPAIGRGHAEVLMDTIEQAMGEAGAGWGEIAKLAVGIGPGSFTGIRVAVAAARGFELSLGIPSVGVSTLEAQAEPFWGEGAVWAVHDAKRGEVYAALYGPGGEERMAPRALTHEAFAAMAPGTDRLVGSGAALAAELLDVGPEHILSAEPCAPIEAIARIGARRPLAESPLPLYLRGADAKAQKPLGLRAFAPT